MVENTTADEGSFDIEEYRPMERIDRSESDIIDMSATVDASDLNRETKRELLEKAGELEDRFISFVEEQRQQ